MTDNVEDSNVPDEGNTPIVNPSDDEARVFGWVPLEEFKGNKEDWRDSDAFLARGREINGFLRKDLDKLKSELSRKDNELSEIRSTLQEFAKFHQETEAKTYQRVLNELKQAKKEAIEVGDGERVVEIDDQIDEIKASRTTQEPPKVNNNQYEADFTSWLSENKWYEEDKQLQISANGLIDEVRRENPKLVGKAFLNAVKDKVQEYFPEKFVNKNKAKPSAVEGSTGHNSSTGSAKKSYADLPPEAKAACDKFVKTIPNFTREQYISEYFS